jgi:hypothetical protein
VKTVLAKRKSRHKSDGRGFFSAIKAREPSGSECQEARLHKGVLGHRVLQGKKNLVKDPAITLWRIWQNTKPRAPHLSISALHAHPDTSSKSLWRALHHSAFLNES